MFGGSRCPSDTSGHHALMCKYDEIQQTGHGSSMFCIAALILIFLYCILFIYILHSCTHTPRNFIIHKHCDIQYYFLIFPCHGKENEKVSYY